MRVPPFQPLPPTTCALREPAGWLRRAFLPAPWLWPATSPLASKRPRSQGSPGKAFTVPGRLSPLCEGGVTRPVFQLLIPARSLHHGLGRHRTRPLPGGHVLHGGCSGWRSVTPQTPWAQSRDRPDPRGTADGLDMSREKGWWQEACVWRRSVCRRAGQGPSHPLASPQPSAASRGECWPRRPSGTAGNRQRGRSSRCLKAHCALRLHLALLPREPAESHWLHFWPDTCGCLLYPTHHVTPRAWPSLGGTGHCGPQDGLGAEGTPPGRQAQGLPSARLLWSVCGLSPGP